MPAPHEVVDAAIRSIEHLRANLAKSKGLQVRSRENRDAVRATALAWFSQTRPAVTAWQGAAEFATTDAGFTSLLEASDRNSLRKKYFADLRDLKQHLSRLRTRVLSAPPGSPNPTAEPDFSPLVADELMRRILSQRWRETEICLRAGAPLAAVVMMGGLLEGLLLARVNTLADKAPVFRAATAPRDKGGVTLSLREWTLKHYLDVAHELGWIGRSARDVGAVLRDYRNYVHPEKQRSQGMTLTVSDAAMLWTIAETLAAQVLASTT